MRKSKASLFLMELLISLLFFAFAGAICLQLFVGAHNFNRQSEKLSNVSALLTNYAEEFYSSTYLQSFSDIIYYDNNLNLVNYDTSAYKVITYANTDNNIISEHIIISDVETDEVLLEYDLKKYLRRSDYASEEK